MTANVISVDAFLCDAVQGVGGKLYAIGIGWNGIQAMQIPARHSRLGIGLVIRVPYTATNQAHRFSVHIEDEDGESLPLGDAAPGVTDASVKDGKVMRVEGQFNVGRPPTLAPGDEQNVPFAVQLDGLEFPRSGLYAVVVKVDDTEMSRLRFRLSLLQQMQLGPAG
jgi:uncharacterized protein affecting Mg2+/Co2+ transport